MLELIEIGYKKVNEKDFEKLKDEEAIVPFILFRELKYTDKDTKIYQTVVNQRFRVALLLFVVVLFSIFLSFIMVNGKLDCEYWILAFLLYMFVHYFDYPNYEVFLKKKIIKK